MLSRGEDVACNGRVLCRSCNKVESNLTDAIAAGWERIGIKIVENKSSYYWGVCHVCQNKSDASGRLHPLDSLAARVHKANAKWWIDLTTGERIERNVGELLMLATSELAEALEGHRKNLMDDKLPHRKMFDVEIVDCFIRLFDIAGGLRIDLGAIFDEKMAYNAVREDHKIESRLKADGKKY